MSLFLMFLIESRKAFSENEIKILKNSSGGIGYFRAVDSSNCPGSCWEIEITPQKQTSDSLDKNLLEVLKRLASLRDSSIESAIELNLMNFRRKRKSLIANFLNSKQTDHSGKQIISFQAVKKRMVDLIDAPEAKGGFHYKKKELKKAG